MADPGPGLSLRFEGALRLSASGHRDQLRKGSGIPYVEHPFAVALMLDRAGFEEDVAIAGLLHDLVEDTDVTLDRIRQQFGDRVASIVGYCSEVKLDAAGNKRPWIDRKRGHIAEVAHAPHEVWAVLLADKLHNLISIKRDLADGLDVWATFNAGKDQVLWYYRAIIKACEAKDPRLVGMKAECSRLVEEVAEIAVASPSPTLGR